MAFNVEYKAGKNVKSISVCIFGILCIVPTINKTMTVITHAHLFSFFSSVMFSCCQVAGLPSCRGCRVAGFL